MNNNAVETPANLEKLKQQNKNAMNDPFIISSNRQKFYYYTQRSTANKILAGSESIKPHFRISSLDGMNDRHECDMHEEAKNRVYALCFSYTDSESIPMWYLYSGISGEGIRIGITAKKMAEFIKRISKVYPIDDYGFIDLNSPLYAYADFSVEYGWIYYVGTKNIIYKNDVYERKEEDDERALKLFVEENFFVKDYEWNYEKEFRIVFRLKDDYARIPPKKIALFYDKEELLKKGGGLSAKAAPEMKNVSIPTLAEELGIPEKKVSKSNLNIRMDLINRNRDSIIEYFSDITRGIENKNDLEKMAQLIETKKRGLPESISEARRKKQEVIFHV